jgi:Holliday junction resolvase RusA-like endonuclease
MLSTMIKYKLLPKSKKKPKKKNNNLNNYKSNNLNSWNKSVNTTHKISNQKININTSLNYQLKISNKNHQTPNQHQNPKKINVSIILINHNTLAHEHQ